MNRAILRVEGPDEALHFLRTTSGLTVASTWRAGEPTSRGPRAASGFAIDVADAPSPVEMVKAIRPFLAECARRQVDFAAGGLSTELSIGVTAGDSVQFVAFVDLPVADLRRLSDLGIALSVAAYPTSDAANGR
jgi:hypothetical protein